MKTPEEIKRGLECCAIRQCCQGCPYDGVKKNAQDCMDVLQSDGLAYIRKLECGKELE